MEENSTKKNDYGKLVTIIAIILLLALVATFAGLYGTAIRDTQKGDMIESNQLIKNLNAALKTAYTADNAKNETMYDALKDAEKFGGYLVETINRAGLQNEILWDQVNDRFVYLDATANGGNGKIVYDEDLPSGATKLAVGDYRLWKISNAVDGTYSTYYTGTNREIETDKGFDVGESNGIVNITYKYADGVQSNARDNVIIRTNSYDTALTINAENDTVRHFGKANSVDVKSVSLNSYQEYGDVLGNINLEKGNVFLKEGCKASAVVIDMTASELATVTTISADNTAALYVPILLKTTEEDWGNNSHKNLINPEKNNIIYTIPDGNSTVVKESEGDNIEDAVAYAKNADKYYMSVDTAINSADENEYIIILKDDQIYHNLQNDPSKDTVNYVADGVTIDLSGHSLKWQKGAWITGGENLTIKNGTLKGTSDGQSYSCFFGDDEHTSVSLSNLNCVGGANFYNTTATMTACNVTLNAGYNAVWADGSSVVTIESGVYDNTNRNVGYGVIGNSDSIININGGMFLSNDENYLLSTSEYKKDEYESQFTGVYINGGKFNVNVSDFTFLVVKNGEIKEQHEHVSLLQSGYKCEKEGDLWIVKK